VESLVILGCGYVGTRIAKTALAAGRSVRVCSRSTGRLQELGALGAEVKFVDASTPKTFITAMSNTNEAAVVYAIPPVTTLPPGHAMRAALQAAYGASASCFIFFSSCGLYGDSPDDDTWIDEDVPTNPDGAMKAVESDEAEVAKCSFDLRTVTLRLAPVYGPGRGVRERIRKGLYRILDEGQHVTSRIHVDDVARVVFAAEERGANKTCVLVGDDEPVTQGEYAKWLSERMGLPLPASRLIFEPGKARTAHRNRRIRNTRMKELLGVTLAHPTYRDGEAAIEAELGETPVIPAK
jgi:nucleoside-diphosphate-sugar epimerase